MRFLIRNRPLVACLSFVLLLKLLVPVGYMPDVSSDAFTIVVCPSGMPQGFDAGGKNDHAHHHQGQHGKSAHDVCAFGASPHAAIASTLFILSFLLLGSLICFARRDEHLAALTSQAAWPRGPPAL